MHPTDLVGARRALDGLIAHLGESCIGFVGWTGLGRRRAPALPAPHGALSGTADACVRLEPTLKPKIEIIAAPEPVFDRTSKLCQAEISQLLAKAAIKCVELDIDVDTFMRGAWSAYVEARPGMRERLEELRLARHLAYMRHKGRLAAL